MIEKYKQYIKGDKVILPYGLEEIEDNAFFQCDSIRFIEIPDSVKRIGSQAFCDCFSLTEIEIPNSVTEIGYNAFWGCPGLSQLEIPNSVTTIGSNAFRDCSGITDFRFPKSVLAIGNGVLAGCSNLESIVVQENNTAFVSVDNCLLDKESGTVLFAGCKNSIIPQSVTKIEDAAFEDIISLTSIIIPDNVVEIGVGAFAGTGLTNVIIPTGVKRINYYAFDNCSNLIRCDIPESVIEINQEAFSRCPNLKELYLRYNDPTESALDGYCFDVYSDFLDDCDGYRIDYYKDDQFHNITLIVPIGTGYAYRHHPFFGQFKEILPIL